MRETMTSVGIISDTHGRFDPALPQVFAGVIRIIHAGDVGGQDVLQRLALIAPVTAVSGNVDRGGELADLEPAARVDVAGVRFLVAHIKDYILRTWDPAGYGIGVVVSGHSHRAKVEKRDGVLYVNPGAAGAQRFGLPRTVALVDIVDGRLTARIVPLA